MFAEMLQKSKFSYFYINIIWSFIVIYFIFTFYYRLIIYLYVYYMFLILLYISIFTLFDSNLCDNIIFFIGTKSL